METTQRIQIILDSWLYWLIFTLSAMFWLLAVFFVVFGCLLAVVPEILNGQTYNATVIGLSPWVEYEFRVVAGNSIGIGEPSKPSELLRTKASGKKCTAHMDDPFYSGS